MSYLELSNEELIQRIKSVEKENDSLKKSLSKLSSQKLPNELTDEQNIELLNVLLDISKQITHYNNFKDSAKNIFHHVKRLIKADVGYVALLNKESNLNEIVYLDKGSQTCNVDPNLPMPVRGYRKLVYESKEVMFHNDFGKSKWMKLLPKGHALLSNIMFVPIVVDNEVIGLIGMANKKGGFNHTDAKIANEFSKLAVIALQYSESIEESERLKEKLKDNEERFRLMTENSPVLVWESGKDAKCTYFNKSWLKFRGRKMEEEVGDGWIQGVHPDDRDSCVHDYLNAFKKRERFEIEYRLKNYKGEYRWISDFGVPQYDSSDNFTGFIGSCIDITERKLFEKVQKEKEELYNSLFEINQAVKLIIDPANGRIIDANSAAENFYGFPKEVLMKMKITDINQLSEKEAFEEMQKAKSEQRMFFEFVHKLADGTLKDVAVYSGPIIYKGKKHLYSIISDITDQKKAKIALRRSEERFKLIIDALPQFISYCSSDFRYIYVNKTYEKEFGIKQAEIQNRKVVDIIGEKSFEQSKKHLQKVISGKYVRYYEKFEYKNGSVKHIDGQLIPQFLENKVVGYFAVLTDISTYMEAREALESSEKEKRIILESTSEMMMYCDKNLNIIWANQSARNLIQKDEKDIINEKCHHIWFNNDKVCQNCPIEKTLKSGKTEESEILIKNRNFIVKSYPVFNDKGEVEGVVELGHDITEKKKQEDELRKSYHLYRTLASNLPETNIFLLDQDKRILIAEGIQFKIGKFRKIDFEDKSINELPIENEISNHFDTLCSIALKGKKKTSEVYYKKRWYSNTVVPIINIRDNVIGCIILSQDITKRKLINIEVNNYKNRLQKLTQHLQQFIEKENTKLAREIHDDLGQNLTFVKLNLALLQKKLLEKFDEKDLVQFTKSYDMINKLIDKVKKVSGELRPTLIDDLGIVPAIEWQLSHFSELTGIKCNFKYKNEDLKLEQNLAINLFRILQESLTNCTKYAQATELNVSLEQNKSELIFSIHNNGVGIKKSEIEKANSFGITGMKERVELFDGSFEVKGNENGTFINIVIPLN